LTLSWIALVVAILANILANSLLKKAVLRTTVTESGNLITGLIIQPYFWAGIVSAGILLGAYLLALRSIPLSICYTTVTALAMIGLILTGAVWFDESLSLMKIIGTILVATGLFVIVSAP